MFKKKIDPRNIALMLCSILFSLGVLEIILRILFAQNQSFLVKSHLDRSYLYKTKYWKVWHYPNAQSNHYKDCFNALYETNSAGMRGTEPRTDSKFRIALIGDSYVEGYGKNLDEIFPHLLDSLTGKDVEILNFSTSGGFGTVNEVALYENLATHFKPDLVLLFYLNYNDAYDNMNSIDEGLISKEMQLTYPVGNKEQIMAEINQQKQPDPTSAIISSFYVTSLANKGFRAFNLFFQSVANMKADFQMGLAKVYSPQHAEEFQAGYDAARKSLARFKELTSRDSAQFVVFNLSDPYQLDENWIEASELKHNLSLDPKLPNKIIGKMSSELGVNYHDMYPVAKSYIKENNLQFPYFSHSCDRHPSKMGHQYLAKEVFKYLIGNYYLNSL